MLNILPINTLPLAETYWSTRTKETVQYSSSHRGEGSHNGIDITEHTRKTRDIVKMTDLSAGRDETTRHECTTITTSRDEIKKCFTCGSAACWHTPWKTLPLLSATKYPLWAAAGLRMHSCAVVIDWMGFLWVFLAMTSLSFLFHSFICFTLEAAVEGFHIFIDLCWVSNCC